MSDTLYYLFGGEYGGAVLLFLFIFGFGIFMSVIFPFAIIAIELIALSLYVLLRYFLSALALFLIAREKKKSHPWFAFIPYLNTFLKLSINEGNIVIFDKELDREKTTLYTTLGLLAYDYLLRTALPFKPIFDFAKYAVLAIRDYDMYKGLDSNNAVYFVIFYLVCPIAEPIILWIEYFKLRKNRKLIEEI